MHLTLEFGGGLELLFGSQKKHEVDVVLPNGLKEVTMESLLSWIKENLLKERPEMFLKENSVRPGVLVLVNDSDWELCGRLETVLEDNDELRILFLHHSPGWSTFALKSSLLINKFRDSATTVKTSASALNIATRAVSTSMGDIVEGSDVNGNYDLIAESERELHVSTQLQEPSATEGGPYDYTRSGNPTRDALERTLAKLEDADRAFCFTSGMAALATITRLAEAVDCSLAKDICLLRNAEGTGLSPFDCWLCLRGVKTMALRVEKQQANSQKIAEFLVAHPLTTRVNYAGLRKHTRRDLHCS